jgi:hypothetical protein
VLIDTHRGRIQFFFTTSLSVNGIPMWKKVSARPVKD